MGRPSKGVLTSTVQGARLGRFIGKSKYWYTNYDLRISIDESIIRDPAIR